MQIGVAAQNGEQPIRLPNGHFYPRVEVEQRTHSGDEIEREAEIGSYFKGTNTIFKVKRFLHKQISFLRVAQR